MAFATIYTCVLSHILSILMHSIRDKEQVASIRVGTADLLTMLKTEEPNIEFTLALGADTFVDLVNGKWRRSDEVLQLVDYRIVVFKRLEEESNNSSSSTELQQQHDEKVQECIEKLNLRVDATTTWNSVNITVTQIPAATQSRTGVSVSSSAARTTTNETELREILSTDVIDYIRERKMYAFSDVR